MKCPNAPFALLMLFLAAGSRADPLPATRVGSWDTTVTIAGQPAAAVQKVCRAQNSFDPSRAMDRFEKAGMNCSKKEVSSQGPVVSMDYVCTLKDTQITSHSETTVSADTAFHSEVHTRYANTAKGTVTDTGITVDAKWTGPCTADQTPE
ncbi:MAG: DUF3617 family protein [Burkholderiaceae bacterium]|jgi:hypothetical protein